MPAAVETAVFANTPAWHGLGNVLDTEGDKGLTVEVALPASGLDWEVVKQPAFTYPVGTKFDEKTGLPVGNVTPIRIPDRFATQRVTDSRPFGTVGGTWEPVQNVEGFKIIDSLIDQASAGTGKAWIESAISLEGGKKVAILVHIENDWQIAGEQYMQYVLFTNGHDGRSSVAAATTNVRVVCANTLALALSGNQRVIRVRHTVKAADRIKEAAHVLELRNQYTEQMAIQGEFLAEQSMSDAEFDTFLASLMPIKDGQEDKPAGTMIKDRRSQVRQVYATASNLDTIRGTRWGALNAVVEYADFGREFKDQESALKNQFGLVGSGTALKDRAFTIVKNKKLEAVPA